MRQSIATAFLYFACSVSAGGPKGTTLQVVVPKQTNLYGDPAYYAWIPEGVATLRSVIVHQHGCTREGDAQQMMNDLQWLSLAKKWNSAFVAPRLITGAPGSGSSQCSNWFDPANGSGNTFLAALDSLARRSGHAEIKTIPWVLWGHSGGSMWITAMTGKYPERVAAGIAQSCGRDISGVPAALQVPILHHNGKADICYNGPLYAPGRKLGALWAFAVNPVPDWANKPPNFGQPLTVLGHAPVDLRMLAIPWLEAAMAARLPDQAGSASLKPMDASAAWLGDTATKAIASAATFTGDKSIASWFPNALFAQRWKEYMATGTQQDTTAPPAPYRLTGTYANRSLRLAWDADADLEGGIKTFTLYRNGAALTALSYNNGSYFTTEKGFQRWQDGDQPTPSPAPAMTYSDNNLNEAETYVYQVATVNWSGTTGPKSESLTLKGGQVTVGVLPRASGVLAEIEAGEIHDLRGRRLVPDKAEDHLSGPGILRIRGR